MEFINTVSGIFLGVFLFLSGPVFTIINLYKVFSQKTGKTWMDIITFIVGILLTFLLYLFLFYGKTYDRSIVIGELHEPVFEEHLLTIVTFFWVGIISYICLKLIVRKNKLILPPLIIVILMAGVYIGLATCIVVMIQIFSNVGDNPMLLYLCLLPFNYVIYAVSMIIMVSQIKAEENIKAQYKNVFLNKCNQILFDSRRWKLLALFMFFPLLGLVVMILTLFGQQPDSMINAFTYTSDWVFSTKVSPPPHPDSGHYLCTVATEGHRSLVKPIRYGMRHGGYIIVNRQLCVANAFEQIIEERMPRFHTVVRGLYDRYGLPLSRYIRTPFAADIIYIAMKPLEYLFVVVLYLFDVHPEKRISQQYALK